MLYFRCEYKFNMNQELNIRKNYKEQSARIPDGVELVAVSKTHPAEVVQQVYDLGQRIFGENKVQELIAKYPQLPKDIKWHIIGHLQTNKVKYIAPFVDTVQSVDSEKILNEIDKQAAKCERKINVLLQVKIAEEDTKYGLDAEQARTLYQNYLDGKYAHVEITGLMGMATFTDDQEQIRAEFRKLKTLFDELSGARKLTTLSMGMSGDYELAIECGATSVRVGSAIFGHRQYDL
ncbi:FIG018583: protein of unknown function [Flavobacteriaceae bacterium 3519-10]|nr:FIG018583: protein of unknown function [Flavobacteriaceae bacterium 3519-10]